MGILVGAASVSYANKPLDIHVSTNSGLTVLHVRVHHPSYNPRKRYIRLVEIYVDEDKPIVKRFYFQKGPYHEFSIPFSGLKDAEKVIIRAYPRYGAYLEKEFPVKDIPRASDTSQQR